MSNIQKYNYKRDHHTQYLLYVLRCNLSSIHPFHLHVARTQYINSKQTSRHTREYNAYIRYFFTIFLTNIFVAMIKIILLQKVKTIGAVSSSFKRYACTADGGRKLYV